MTLHPAELTASPDLLAVAIRLPLDRPFTTREADALGADSVVRRRLVQAGVLRRPVRSVYLWEGLPDTLEVRVAVLRLVVPSDCVITDWAAAWLWGAPMVLPPNAHLAPPQVTVFAPPGRRLRNSLTASGERRLRPTDIQEVQGLLVTTPLRTACDVARLLRGGLALGTVDMIAKLGAFTIEELEVELRRFKGYRGIVQARVVARYADPRSGSIMEGVTRWVWIGAGLPRPTCQAEVEAPVGSYYVDLGLPDEHFGAEFYGEEFHTEQDAPHDEERHAWICEVKRWTVPIARRDNVTGRRPDFEATLRREWRAHHSRRTILDLGADPS